MFEPVPVILENGAEKTQGLILRLTVTGMQVELDKIPFAVGTYLNVHIQFEPEVILIEKTRSIKHYDKFYRTPPAKKAKGAATPPPKKLCELHFTGLSESSKLLIAKHILKQQDKAREMAKQKMKKTL